MKLKKLRQIIKSLKKFRNNTFNTVVYERVTGNFGHKSKELLEKEIKDLERLNIIINVGIENDFYFYDWKVNENILKFYEKLLKNR